MSNYQHLPQPSTKSFKSKMSRTSETRFHRLVLNHTLLREHRSKMFPDQYPSPDCECGTDVQSIDHYLFNCPLIENQITSLVNSIDVGFVKTSTQTLLRFINRSVLLGENYHLKPRLTGHEERNQHYHEHIPLHHPVLRRLSSVMPQLASHLVCKYFW